MSVVCDDHRLEFLTQLVVVVEASERNAVALSQVAEWDVLLLTLINRTRSFVPPELSPTESLPQLLVRMYSSRVAGK
jgi:hypothetical protein